jgi:hypothetical protein
MLCSSSPSSLALAGYVMPARRVGHRRECRGLGRRLLVLSSGLSLPVTASFLRNDADVLRT